MLKKLSNKLSEYPGIYTFLRKIIENNFKAQRKVISQEVSGVNGKILDVPCGIGEFSVFFDKKNYVGVDLSKIYVDYAKRKYGKIFVVGDALNLVFDDDYFNFVFISGFFHHLDLEQVKKSIFELNRILSSGGKALIIEDSPGKSFAVRKLQKYDVGANIRDASVYSELFEKYFVIEKKYPMKSGMWDYTVFVLKKK
ncbi:class I SAM-dependent methyltransferase [Candidatus Woesearchaeota archaeon]|jgi:ubiquinone/menaquinone biosynthesis C-methylase UbiE|nr:class I SAM-dependent methyltransferase [Candidatus Woesearchaeota archaeon]